MACVILAISASPPLPPPPPSPPPPCPQWPLLKRHWWVILLCLLFQYVHGVFTQLAYILAAPLPAPLPDLGFEALPELPLSADWASESLFYTLFFGGIAWVVLAPFCTRRAKFTAVGALAAALPALVLCQALRIACFQATRLPSPAPHCLSGAETPVKPRPAHWWQYVVVNVVTQASKSCGDLIFSSHMIFALSFAWMYTRWGGWRAVKALYWAACVALSLLIIASRKHYTVDVVVAWMMVPLVFHALAGTARWARLEGRPEGEEGGGGGGGGLPVPAPTERGTATGRSAPLGAVVVAPEEGK